MCRGDDPAVIASGPTVANTSTIAQVWEIVGRYGVDLPPAVRTALQASTETPKPGAFESDVRIIAAPLQALEAAAAAARAAGLTPLILGDALEGESRELGTIMAGIARSVAAHGRPVAAPAVLLSGGETTVTIGQGGAGSGGRNTEFLLGFAAAAQGAAGIWALAGDSDGIDGTEDAAGAIVTPDTLARARAAGLDLQAALTRARQLQFFQNFGRPSLHRADADQCERHPRGPDHRPRPADPRKELREEMNDEDFMRRAIALAAEGRERAGLWPYRLRHRQGWQGHRRRP